MDFDVCYRALRARDARFDGLFFVGVSTTGIYCRSICAARTPKATSCQFFPQAAAAEQAGFRPCLRCRPELAPAESRPGPSLAQALYRAIQEQALSEASLANLGARTGYSSRQLRRLIGECFGITPEHILTTLQSGFGIGPWTANYIAMRALRLPDAFPTADLGLLKATGLTSGKKLESLSQKWRPWRAYATLHLWQSL